ncbi:MAG TPA: hypothetical protein VF701_02865 [Thermoanaerobaculia bacterium]
MKTLLAVTARELRGNSQLFAISAALAVIPFLAAMLPAAASERPAAIGLTGLILAVAIALGAALLSGVSTVAGALTNGRMPFYFSRPIPPSTIWIGKALASIGGAMIAFVIVALPSFLASGEEWPDLPARGLVSIAAAIAVVFLLSHTLASMVRSHTPLIAVDLVLGVIFACAAALIVRPILLGGGFRISAFLAAFILVGLFATMAFAPLRQLSEGRTDIRRSHAALSRTLWPALALILLIAGGYVLWITSVKPWQLRSVGEFASSPDGRTATLTGFGRNRGDFAASFIIDTKSGDYERVRLWWGHQWSRDGRLLAWFKQVQIFSTRGPVELELHVRTPEGTEATGIRANAPAAMVLSDDGSRVAIHSGGKLAVHDLREKRLIAAVNLPQQFRYPAMLFVGNDRLRLLSTNASQMTEMFEFDTRTRLLSRTGSIDSSESRLTGFPSSADGSLILLRMRRDAQGQPGGSRIIDGRSGELIATIPISSRFPHGTAMLHDGRVGVIETSPEMSRLSLYSPAGEPAGSVALAPGVVGSLAGETQDGALILSTIRAKKEGEFGFDESSRAMVVIDLASLTVRRHVAGIRGPYSQFTADSRLPMYAADSTFMAIGAKNQAVLWNVQTGEIRGVKR